MAVRPGARIPMHFEHAFPHGAFATGVAPVMEFQDGRQTGRQETDAVSNLPVWNVAIIDGDPELSPKQKSLAVKVAAPVQPVLPDASIPGVPFIPVGFEGLTVTPYVDSASRRLAYSYRATGVIPARMPAQAKKEG